MTLHVPLDCFGSGGNKAHTTMANPPSTLPPFVKSSADPDVHINAVFDSILKAKRIAVVCGAGISVEAGIPDFRSPDGLFQSLKRDNPKESLTSGKDLFDASVFKSTEKTALFCRMIASLASLSSQSEPTSFHEFLRTLDDRGQLLRVYTQNIDALEMKAGLSFGVPEFEDRFLRSLGRTGKAKGKSKARAQGEEGHMDAIDANMKKNKTKPKGRRDASAGLYSYTPKKAKNKISTPMNAQGDLIAPELDSGPSQNEHIEKSAVPLLEKESFTSNPAPPSSYTTIPRCIPLHGTLQWLHCQHCTQTFPLHTPPPLPQSRTPPRSVTSSPDPSPTRTLQERESSPTDSSLYTLHALLSQGTPPPCPSCTSLEQTRALVGKRLRGVGKLRPSVVLYGEEHREGESVGEVVRRDLCGIQVATLPNDDLSKGPAPSTSQEAAISEADGNALSSTEKAPLKEVMMDGQQLDSIREDKVADSLTPGPTSPPKSKHRTRTRATGKGPDLLLVVGTSLRVPGTKRIVREFSKAVKSTSSGPAASANGSESSATASPSLGTVHLPTPTPPPSEPSSRQSSRGSKSKLEPKTIYLNKEFPLPARDWEDVFDVWVQGDVQVFARAIAALIRDNCAADEDTVIVTEEVVEDAKKVKRKRKLNETDPQKSLQQTPKKKKKKRKTNAGDGMKNNLFTPPASSHRLKSASKTVARLGAITSNLDSDGQDDDNDEEDIINVDMDDNAGMIDSPGFQLRRLLDMDIIPETEMDTESEPDIEVLRSQARNTMFSPAPTPPPSTKKRKVVLRLPPYDDPPVHAPTSALPVSFNSQPLPDSSSSSYPAHQTSTTGMNPNLCHAHGPFLSTRPLSPVYPPSEAESSHRAWQSVLSATPSTQGWSNSGSGYPSSQSVISSPWRSSSFMDREMYSSTSSSCSPQPPFLQAHSPPLPDGGRPMSYLSYNNDATCSLGDDSAQSFAVGWDTFEMMYINDGVLPVYA